MFGQMRTLAGATLLAAILVAASGCGGGQRGATTDAIQLRVSPSGARLPAGLVREIDSARTVGRSLRAEVYGPGSRAALVKASSGDVVEETAAERGERFYLIVLHGHFVAGSHPAGGTAPRGRIETRVWSRSQGVTDLGIGDRVPAAVRRLPEIAALTLS
jgi:hypothetical protein